MHNETAHRALDSGSMICWQVRQTGWTRPTLIEFLDRLEANYRLHLSVVLEIVFRGEPLLRPEVLIILGLPSGTRNPTWLRGITATVNKMKREDLIPDDAIMPVVAVYEDVPRGAPRPRVKAYGMPAVLVRLLLGEGERDD